MTTQPQALVTRSCETRSDDEMALLYVEECVALGVVKLTPEESRVRLGMIAHFALGHRVLNEDQAHELDWLVHRVEASMDDDYSVFWECGDFSIWRTEDYLQVFGHC